MLFENEWLYLDPSKGRVGPVSVEELYSRYKDGLMGDSNLVSPNNGVWKEIKEIPELQQYLRSSRPTVEKIEANLAQEASKTATTESVDARKTILQRGLPKTTVSQRIGNVLNWLQAILCIAALTFVSYGASNYLATGRSHDLEYGLSLGVLFVVLGLVIAAIAYVASGEFRLLPLAHRNRVITMLIGFPTLGCLSVALFSKSATIPAATIAEGLGGIFPIWLVAYLLGRFIFKSLAVTQMFAVTTLLAYVVAIVVSGYGSADGGSWNPPITSYTISALLVFCLRYGYWLWNNADIENDPEKEKVPK